MKLWILRPIRGLLIDPWEPWYDKAFGFVVQADTEMAARQFAQEEGGTERIKWGKQYTECITAPAWTDPELSTCVELTAVGEPGVVMRDFAAS